MTLKQSVCLPILPLAGVDLDGFLAELAAIGYAAVEIWQRDESLPELARLARQHNLALASMVGHAALEDGLNNPANHDRIEAELRESIDVAVRHGVQGLICFSGNRLAGMSDAEAIANTAAGLRRIAPYAEAQGVTLNLELLNSKVDHPGYQCDHTAWGLAVLAQAPSPRVKLLYDIYHMQIMEGDLIRNLTTYVGQIGHIHTAGNPGRQDLDEQQEINYAAVCRALAAAGYAGFVGHEFRPKGETLPALRQAYDVCRGV
ncbi:MAG: TIM barrel protein [Anaerolineales bacterium]|nr:TIM barrel protein [Anaerolineales bacterium]